MPKAGSVRKVAYDGGGEDFAAGKCAPPVEFAGPVSKKGLKDV